MSDDRFTVRLALDKGLLRRPKRRFANVVKNQAIAGQMATFQRCFKTGSTYAISVCAC